MSTRYKLKESTAQSFPLPIPLMDISCLNWIPLSATSGTSPRPRHGHRAVAVNELMIVFGGGREAIFADLHVFNTRTNTWFKPQVKGELPTGCAAFGLTANNDKITMFGGMQEYTRLSNDLYSLNVNTWEWNKLQSFIQHKDIPYPIPRFGHSFTRANEIIYMFGGLTLSTEYCEGHIDQSIFKHTYLNELYTLTDSGKMIWNIPPTCGSPPSPRESHSATYYVNPVGDNYLIIYGGMNSARLGDVWFLDIRSMSWIQPIISGIPPLPRSLHSANVIGNGMIIFGGWVPATTTKDAVWKCTDTTACLNLCNMTWETPKTNQQLPKARSGHSAVSIHSRLYIFSGRDGYTAVKGLQVCLADLWYLEVDKPAKPNCPQVRQASATSLLLTWNPVPSATAYILQMRLLASTSRSSLLEECNTPSSRISRINKIENLFQAQQHCQQSEDKTVRQNFWFNKSPLASNSNISHHQSAASRKISPPNSALPLSLSSTKSVNSLQIQNQRAPDNMHAASNDDQTNKSSLTTTPNNNGSTVGLPSQSSHNFPLLKKGNFVWSLNMEGKRWVIIPQKTVPAANNQRLDLQLFKHEQLSPAPSQSVTSNSPLSIPAASTTQNSKPMPSTLSSPQLPTHVQNVSPIKTYLSREPEEINQTEPVSADHVTTRSTEIKNVILEETKKQDIECVTKEDPSDEAVSVVDWHNVGIMKDTKAIVVNYCAVAAPELSHVKIITDEGIENVRLDSTQVKTEVQPDTHYKMRVAGINSHGLGPWSDICSIKTWPQGCPAPPSHVQVKKSGSHTYISWQAPESPHKIIEYSIYLAVEHQPPSDKVTTAKFTKIYTGPATECVIHNNTWNCASIITRDNNAAIVLRISACNAKGYGQAVQVRWLQENAYMQMKRAVVDALGQNMVKKAKSVD